VSALGSFRGSPKSPLSQKGSKSGGAQGGDRQVYARRVWGPKEAHGPRVIQRVLVHHSEGPPKVRGPREGMDGLPRPAWFTHRAWGLTWFAMIDGSALASTTTRASHARVPSAE
jgi:hypothetical protein